MSSFLLSAGATPAVQTDLGGRTRSSLLTTLFDGKVLREEDPLIWSTAGTGTSTFSEAGMTMAVTAGQYLVRQSKQYIPYFSGKPQLPEITFENFAPQAGLIKRVGYFSSSAVAPYSVSLDGWYLESNGTTGDITLNVVNAGTSKLAVRMQDWTGYSQIEGYNWDNFTVSFADFLWLGGAGLRLFLKSPNGGFVQAHVFDYAGTAQGIFMRSPNQPVRYEIRSTTGSGSLRAICSQVASEGSLNSAGKSLGLVNTTTVACNTAGTVYALKSIKKRADRRDIPVTVERFGGVVTTANDAGIYLLLLNPSLSAPLTYANNSQVVEGTATNQTIATNALGRVIDAVHTQGSGVSFRLTDNFLRFLGSTVNDTMDEIVLAYQPLTANQQVSGGILAIEY